ncbi:MAG: UxaA family hydrolase [Desulfobacterales bacterium]|nr:UxaA family hydrolase [Desulfobacterales bacterium]
MSKVKAVTKKLIIMNPEDNVAVCLCSLEPGEEIDIVYNNDEMVLKIMDQIPLGHKVSLKKILKETSIIKYGEIIGKAKSEITVGKHVHVHNVTDY